jgi:dTDP-4-dehydrorhamnose reductase
MLGRDLVSCLEPRHCILPLTRKEADITDPRLVDRACDEAEPDIVIHCAAFTAVDDCELRPELAFKVNAEGTENVARACRKRDIPILYLSTDYVFDGEKPEPYVETDRPSPLNVYGQTKLAGEESVKALVARFWIVRVSWLFGPWGRNFVRAILDQAHTGRPLRVVADQVGAPTYTMDLAEKIEAIFTRGEAGIYHVTNQGCCSWFEFANEILHQAGLDHITVSPIPSTALDRRARRPRNSRLANNRLEASGLGLLPAWKDAVRSYLSRANEAQEPFGETASTGERPAFNKRMEVRKRN